jgi:hypothetical protein
MKVQPKYIRLLGDALIPLLGYFLWDWSLYFILIFYFIDIIINEIVMHFKSKKILEFNPEQIKKDWIKFGIQSLFLFLPVLFIAHFALSIRPTQIDFWKEFIAFLSYKELGIEQGYVLIPLLVLMGYQSYKLEFIIVRKHLNTSLDFIWKPYLKAQLLLLAFSALGLGILSLINLPDVVILLLIIGISSSYNYFTNLKTIK